MPGWRTPLAQIKVGKYKSVFCDVPTSEVWGNEDLMAAEEEWAFSDKNGKILDSGKSIELFKMEDGKWRLYRDCYNSDMPIPKK